MTQEVNYVSTLHTNFLREKGFFSANCTCASEVNNFYVIIMWHNLILLPHQTTEHTLSTDNRPFPFFGDKLSFPQFSVASYARFLLSFFSAQATDPKSTAKSTNHILPLVSQWNCNFLYDWHSGVLGKRGQYRPCKNKGFSRVISWRAPHGSVSPPSLLLSHTQLVARILRLSSRGFPLTCGKPFVQKCSLCEHTAINYERTALACVPRNAIVRALEKCYSS